MAKVEEINTEERADIEQLDIGTAFKEGKNYYIQMGKWKGMTYCLSLDTMSVAELSGDREVTPVDIVKITVRPR